MFSESFKPAWWCRSAHAQTIAGALFRNVPPLFLKRRRLDLPDGDFLDVDYLQSEALQPRTSPAVLILHGLEGSSQSPYVQCLLAQIQKQGWRAAAMNFRMCSGEPNRLPVTYHSGKTEDLDYVVSVMKQEFPHVPLYLVGFSIGGNIILKWMGEQKGHAISLIEKAAVISVPYDLERSVERLSQGFNREVYTRSLITRLCAKLRDKQKHFPGRVRYEQALKSRTFADFDRWITAPLNGFKDEFEYWRMSSSKYYLKDIHVPTLLIHAADDPFFEERFLPLQEIQSNPALSLLLTQKGGHVGFVSGAWPWRLDPWLEKQIVSYFGTAKGR